MKKALLCLFAVAAVLLCALALPQTAHAASADDLTFTLNETGDGYIVSDCDESADGELAIPATYNGLPVTAIGDYAFEDCDRLTGITIPDSVTTIGYDAFAYCSSLASITIPDGVTSIGNSAFFSCSSLTSVSIGNSVTSIGSNAFSWCINLIGITIPDSVTSIGDSAFYYCTSLTGITIPDSVTSIGNSAFYYCDSLASITIPDSVTAIDQWAFGYCSSLTSIIIPDSVTSIGLSAFYYCDSLTSITIPDSVISIGDYAFCCCDRLTSVTYCGTQEQWDVIEFGTNNESLTNATLQFHNVENGVCTICGYKKPCDPSVLTYTLNGTGDGYIVSGCDRSAVGELKIPATYNGLPVTAIGDSVFYESGLAGVIIPDSVTTIGNYAFSYCYRLADITIPDSVTAIGEYAFYSCNCLTGVAIPDSVTAIGQWAFGYCSSLTSVTYCGTQEQWDATSISDGNTSLTDATFQFHNMVKGVCAICEHSVMTFTLNGTGDGYIVSDCNTSFEGELAIPATYNGLPVTAIGDYAFEDCDSLTWITIPDSVTAIGNCVFSSCYSLTGFSVAEGNPAYSHDAYGVLFDKNKTTLVAVPAVVVGSYTIPDSVTAVGNYAFFDCAYLTGVTIPDGVTTIGKFAFSYCYRLTDITIPDSVTSIGDYAFCYCDSLTSITIPDGVTSIGVGAFNDCARLTGIIIPDSVTSIGECAFDYCDSLTIVIFCGNQDQWEAIAIGDYNSSLTAATFQFHNMENDACAICGAKRPAGDVDGNFVVNYDDAVCLLLNTLFGEENYPLNGASGDVDGDGAVDSEDAIYLLLHVMFGEAFYPIKT